MRGATPRCRQRVRCTTVVALLGALLCGTVHAHPNEEDQPDSEETSERPGRSSSGLSGWYLPAGFVLAASMDTEHGFGGQLGAELSVVCLDRRWNWRGVYADGVRDFASGSWRATGGLEFGRRFFGLDAGYAMRVSGERFHSGLVVRPMLSTGAFTTYLRGGIWFDSQRSTFAEVGLLLKYPFRLGAWRSASR